MCTLSFYFACTFCFRHWLLFICWEEDPTPFHRGVIDGTFLSMVRSVSLIVLCIFAKRFVLSVSGFLSQRNFCTTAVLLWGTHWGAVSWIVLFFSCRAIPRAILHITSARQAPASARPSCHRKWQSSAHQKGKAHCAFPPR